MPGIGPSLTLSDIAKLAEVGVSAASNWRKRHANFPTPTLVSEQELFATDEVLRWLGERKIARNSLKPEETPGTTYGDRFALNSGATTSNTQAEPANVHAEVTSSWTNRLWQIMDFLRSDLEPVSAVDFIMTMLYIRKAKPELWHLVMQQPSWNTVAQVLKGIYSSEGDVPFFATQIADLRSGQRLLEAIKLFDDVEFEGVKSASMFDALLDKVNRDLGKRGGHYTPPSLVKCMLEVLGPQSTNTVYDPSSGSGELLVAAAQRGVESLFGQAINVRSSQMTMLNLLMHDSDADLRIGEPRIEGEIFAERHFDLVLSNPPFNIAPPHDVERDSWPFGVPTKSAVNFAWLQLAVHKLKPGGRAVVLMPNGTLFAGGMSAAIRSNMVDAGVVEGIVALPAGLFATTGIPVSLWLLRQPAAAEQKLSDILFIDATGVASQNEGSQRVLGEDATAKIVLEYRNWQDASRRGNSHHSPGFSRSVNIEEVRQNDYNLQPQKYVIPVTVLRSGQESRPAEALALLQQELDELTERIRQVSGDVNTRLAALHDPKFMGQQEARLGDIYHIQAGPGAVNRERGLTVPDWTPIVLPRNITRGHISHDDVDTVSPEVAMKLTRYRLQPGDIVCVRSGTLGRHGLVREAESGWLVGPSCVRLRPISNAVVSEYVVHYLNSSEVHSWITTRAASSTAIPHISTATLRTLAIPIPSISMQRNIAAIMDMITTQIQQYLEGRSTLQLLGDHVFRLLADSHVERIP